MGRRRHEDRVIGIVQQMVGDAAFEPERSVPRASRSIDGIIDMGQPSQSWGPIAPLLANRTVALEHESRPPGRAKLANAVAKLEWLVEAYWLDPDRSGRVPLLLLVTEGIPRWLRSAGCETPPWKIPGIWYSPRENLGDLLVVAPRSLPEIPGTALLKSMPFPRSDQESRRNIERLQADPHVVQSDVRGVMEGIMSGSIPSTQAEQQSILDRLRDKFRVEGRQEGRREALLDLARKRFGEDTAAELATIDDPDELEERLLDLLDSP